MTRVVLAAAYAVYLVCLVLLVFTPGGTAPGGAIELVDDALGRLGIYLSPSTIEVGLNVVLFIPLSLIGGALFRRREVAYWLLIGFVASIVIEVAQLAIPGRISSVSDIVANTVGAGLGALLAAVGSTMPTTKGL